MNRPVASLVDLSHPLESGMAVAPGLPAPRIEPWLSHAASRARYGGLAEFEITRLFLVGNTATSLDAPYHRFPDGADAAALPLGAVAALPGLCVDARATEAGLDLDAEPADLAGHAVLVRTGHDRLFGSADYWAGGPFLSAGSVDALAAAPAILVGVDFANVDDVADLARPAHTRLLGAGIPIVEHLRGLDALPRGGFLFFAAPVAVEGAAALPVRAFALVAG